MPHSLPDDTALKDTNIRCIPQLQWSNIDFEYDEDDKDIINFAHLPWCRKQENIIIRQYEKKHGGFRV